MSFNRGFFAMPPSYNEKSDTAKSAMGKKSLIGIVGAATVALLVPMVGSFEGKRNDPYADLIGKMTVCYGETRVEMRRYSDAECDNMLASGLADFAGPVLQRNPELKGHAPQLAAATSLAYNIGIANYNKSSVARLFSAGRWKDACDAFLPWDKAKVNGVLRPVKGLTARRQRERALCMKDAA